MDYQSFQFHVLDTCGYSIEWSCPQVVFYHSQLDRMINIPVRMSGEDGIILVKETALSVKALLNPNYLAISLPAYRNDEGGVVVNEGFDGKGRCVVFVSLQSSFLFLGDSGRFWTDLSPDLSVLSISDSLTSEVLGMHAADYVSQPIFERTQDVLSRFGFVVTH